MAVTKEIWLNHIVENLFPDNSFMAHSFNADAFVSAGKVVHIPNAAAQPEVVKGPLGKPLTAKALTDTDVDFTIEELYVKPIYMENADKYELSYDKRESVLSRSKNALDEALAKLMLAKWLPTQANRIVKVNALTRKAVRALQLRMNKENIPQAERYLLLDADMYDALLGDLTEAQSNAFLASADAAKGVLGNLYGFNVMMRSEVKDASDKPCGMAWHKDYVCRAAGEHELFAKDNDPEYYGDVLSAMVRAGGAPMRKDSLGVLKVVIDTTAGA